MTDLTDAIDAFLAKYPDDLPLTWAHKPRKPNALDVMVGDLVAASERHRKRTTSPETLPQPTTSEPESVR